MSNKDDAKQYPTNAYLYKRSNLLIGSKYKSTLLSNRVMALCLSRINSAQEDAAGGLSVSIPGSEIQKIMGSSSHNFFKELDSTAQSMTGRTIGWSNPETREFEYTAVVTDAKFSNNIFTIDFNKKMRDYLKDIDGQFTWLKLPVMLSFRSVYSFRLYEVLKSKSYYPKEDKRVDRVFNIEIDLNELRLMLGVINAELASVQSVLNKSKGRPDYEKAVEASPEKVFTKWYELKRNCIDVAVNEINSLEEAEMHVEYEPLKAGRGGKVYAIMFRVELANIKDKASDTSDEGDSVVNITEDDILEEIMELIGVKLKEARSIAVAADWNLDLIKEKFEISHSHNVDSIVGWMIAAIKDNYEPPIKKNKQKDKKVSRDFEERKYNKDDYEKLIKDIVNKD